MSTDKTENNCSKNNRSDSGDRELVEEGMLSAALDTSTISVAGVAVQESPQKITSLKLSANTLSDFSVNSIILTESSNPHEHANNKTSESNGTGYSKYAAVAKNTESDTHDDIPDLSTPEQGLPSISQGDQRCPVTYAHSKSTSTNKESDTNSTILTVPDACTNNTPPLRTSPSTASPMLRSVTSSWQHNNSPTSSNHSLGHRSTSIFQNNNLVDALLLHSPEKSIEQAVNAALSSLERHMGDTEENCPELSSLGEICKEVNTEMRRRKKRQVNSQLYYC